MSADSRHAASKNRNVFLDFVVSRDNRRTTFGTRTVVALVQIIFRENSPCFPFPHRCTANAARHTSVRPFPVLRIVRLRRDSCTVVRKSFDPTAASNWPSSLFVVGWLQSHQQDVCWMVLRSQTILLKINKTNKNAIVSKALAASKGQNSTRQKMGHAAFE